MHPIYTTYKPEGYGTVTAYLMVGDPAAEIQFLKDAFFAEEKGRTIRPETGEIQNAILKIGDTCFMVSQARGDFDGMRTSFYLYVNDVDGMHQRAVAHGAQVLFEPDDMPYEDRQSGVIDPCGNYWWISTRLVEKDYHD